ncbi:oligosaccharide flippase family protein [Haloferax volcanii]|uniref:oligosaccharide flippase family protein n=1 Tax=Haloferax volcanii TaxID=2246 RepID=UPI00349F3DB0
MSDRHIIKGISNELIARVLYYLSTGIVIVVLGRELPNQSYGTLFLLISILSFATTFSTLGFAPSAARFISDSIDENQNKISFIILFSAVFVVSASFITSSTLVILRNLISKIVNNNVVADLLLFSPAYILAYSGYSYSRILLQGFRNVSRSSTVYAVEGIVRVLSVLSLFVIGFSVIKAFSAYVFGYLLSSVMGGVFIYQRVSREYSFKIEYDWSLGEKLMHYSVPLAITRTSRTIESHIDIILLGVFSGPVSVSHYVVAKQVGTFMQSPAAAVGHAVSPYYKEKIDDDSQNAYKFYMKIFALTLIGYLSLSIVVVIGSKYIISILFGNNYSESVVVLQLFSIFVLLKSLTFITENGLDYLGYANRRARIKSISIVFNVLLNVLLIPSFGVIGALVATIGSYAIYAVYTIRNMFAVLALSR